MKPLEVTRREFLRACGLLGTSTLVAACAPTATTPGQVTEPTAAEAEPTAVEEEAAAVEDAVTEPPSGRFQEAPMLTEMVQAGELPPVEERLPLEPKITNEMPPSLLTFENGRYGGELRASLDGEADLGIFVSCNEPLINTPGILAEEFTPNIVKDYEVDDDYTEFTFHMREGLKWSDGEPLTTEDVRFALEDVIFDEDLTPSCPQWLRSGNSPAGEPVEYEIVDDFTFRLKFSEPYGGFLVVLAIQGWRQYTELLKPAHYLKQFHIRYTDEEALKPLLEAEALESWVQLFSLKDVTGHELANPQAVGFPVLYPWMTSEVTQQQVTYTRNPYYFKVDYEGQQLPYIDRYVSYRVADAEMDVMKQISGEVDWGAGRISKMALYRENEERSGFRALVARSHATYTDVFLNLTFDDPVWREVVRNLKFRQALAYAIDREEINDTLFWGLAHPTTLFPGPYDTDQANALLDEIGMDKRDNEGFRLGPDGKTFIIPFDATVATPEMVSVTELVVEFWKTVGIQTTMKVIDWGLWGQRNSANELQATCFWSHSPLWYQADLGQDIWAPLWVRWWTTDGRDGEEPPEDVKNFLAKLDSMSVVPPEEGRQRFEECRQMLRENLYYFVHTEGEPEPLIVSAKLGNVEEQPDALTMAWKFAVEQFFYRE